MLNLVVFAAVGALIVVTTSSSSDGYGWFLLNIALFSISAIIATVLHEAGHALAMALTGGGIRRITIGAGVKVLEFNVRTIPVVVHLLLLSGGMVHCSFPSLSRIKTKYALVLLAGPLANLVAAAAVVLVLGSRVADPYPRTSGLYLPLLFVAINLFLGIANLFPRNCFVNGHRMPNDGLQIVSLRSLPEAHMIWFVIAYYLPPGKELTQQTAYPEYRDLLLAAIQSYAKRDTVTTQMHNLIGWRAVLEGNPQYYQEAEAHAAEALRISPHEWGSMGTYGSLLVERGRLEEGLALLHESNQHVTAPQHKALNLSYIAVGQYRLGKYAEAAESIAAVQSLDPNCVLLGRTLKIVERKSEELISYPLAHSET